MTGVSGDWALVTLWARFIKTNQLELVCKGGEVETFQRGDNWWAALTRLGKICQARRDTNTFFFAVWTLDWDIGIIFCIITF